MEGWERHKEELEEEDSQEGLKVEMVKSEWSKTKNVVVVALFCICMDDTPFPATDHILSRSNFLALVINVTKNIPRTRYFVV